MPFTCHAATSRARRSAHRAAARLTIGLGALAIAGAAPSAAGAAGNRTFSNTFAQTLHGDIATIGNANSTCNPSWTPSPACDTNSTSLNNSTKGYGVLVDVDGDPSTTNSSASSVGLPAGATVAYARLTWGSTGDDTDNNGEATVRFDTPATAGISYQSVAANYATRCGGLNAANANRGTACSADVTALVQAAGSGEYTVGGIEQRPFAASADPVDHWSGWALYIVYEKSDQQLRRIVLSDGFLRVANGVATSPISLTGFTAPASGAVTARLTYAAGEGDAGILNDNATLNSTSLDSTAPIDLMNSSNSGNTYQTSRNPQLNNQYGFDVDSQEVNGAIGNGDTSATFTFSSTGDTYYPFSTGITIDLDEPNVVLTKSLTDVNGGVVESGDVLEYQVVATNSGSDGATDTIITDPIPTYSTYVPGSMQVTAGANAGTKTDAAGDDQADFAANEVTIRAGTGANSTNGGSLAIGASTTVRFRVVLDANLGEGVPVVNTANGAYKGQTALFSYANPSTVVSTPVRRADLVVAQTPGTLVAGQSSDIALVASNAGGASTHGNPVTLSTSVPANVTFGAITSATGWTCNTASLPAITCTRADALAAGASYPAVTYSFTPSQTAPSASFTATVAGGNETDTTNDTDTDNVTFARSADLRITNVPNVLTANVGDTITFAIGGRNLGPSTTTGVAVTGTLPAGLSPLTATLGGAACSIAGQTITCNPGALGVGGASADAAPIVVTAQVLASAAGTTQTFTPSVGGSDPDPAPANNSAAASVTINAAADLALTESRSPATVNPGSNITYVFTVTNNGPSSAAGVSLTDNLPAGVSVVSITPTQGTCGTGDPFTCAVGTLAIGDSATVTVVVTPSLATAGTTLANPGSVTSSTFDTDSSNNAATASADVNAASDLRTTASVDDPATKVGDTVTYTLTMYNDGPSPATGTALSVDLPAGATITSVTPSQGTCPASGDPRSCTLGAIASGGTANVVVVATLLPASAGTTLAVSGAASGNEYDPTPGNNTSSASTTVAQAADVVVTAAVAPSPASPGADVTYTFTVHNNGPGSATGVIFTDDLPAGAVVQSITTTKNTCSSGDPFTCNLGTLANGDTETITVVVRLPLSSAGTTVANPGSVTSTSYDPTSANDSASAPLTVNPAADLRTTASVDFAGASVGDTRNYLFTVVNDGPSTATGASLLVDLPAGATILSVSSSQGAGCPGAADPRPCALGSIAAGASATVSVQIRIEAANAGNVVTASGAASANEFDPNAPNNTASATTNAGDAADLRVTKTADRTTANVGDTITWTITATNDGPQTSLGTTVADAIPAGVTILSATSTVGTCTTGSAISCTVGSLASGGSAVITVVGTVQRSAADSPLAAQASVTGSVFDPVTSNNVSTATTTVGPASDLRLVKLADKANPRIGDTITWTIQIFNDGPSTANAVHLTDVVPAAAPINTLSATAPGCTRAGQSVDCVFASIPGGSSVTVTIVATVANGSGGAPLNNSATVTSSTLDPDASNNTSTSSSTAAGAADLSITLTPDRDTATVGERITWNGVVGNGGPQTAHGVVVTLELPAGLTDVQASTPGGTCTVSGRTVTCTVADVPSGSSGTLVISGLVDRTAADKGLVITGVAAANESDPNPTDNTATGAVVAIAPAVDLRLEKTADRAEVAVGDTLTVNSSVSNRGPSTATDVIVVDFLPDGVDLQSVVPSQGACVVEGKKITCNLGVLANGQTATIATVVVVQAAGAGQKLLSGGSVTSAQFDTDASDNAAEVQSVGVSGAPAPAPFIDLTKTVDKAAPVAGATVVYTITAKNKGNAAATAVRVVDALPAGLDYKGTKVTGGTCTRSARTVTCVASKLDPGASLVVKITVVVVEAGKVIENTASVIADGLPSTPAKGQLASASLKGSGAPFLFAAIRPAAASTKPGATLQIAVKLTNVGVGTARDAKACFKLPASVVLMRRPAGVTQKGAQFCLTAAALAAGKNKRIVLMTRVVGGAGRSKPTITATSSNARTRTQAFAIQVRGVTATRGSGVTG